MVMKHSIIQGYEYLGEHLEAKKLLMKQLKRKAIHMPTRLQLRKKLLYQVYIE